MFDPLRLKFGDELAEQYRGLENLKQTGFPPGFNRGGVRPLPSPIDGEIFSPIPKPRLPVRPPRLPNPIGIYPPQLPNPNPETPIFTKGWDTIGHPILIPTEGNRQQPMPQPAPVAPPRFGGIRSVLGRRR